MWNKAFWGILLRIRLNSIRYKLSGRDMDKLARKWNFRFFCNLTLFRNLIFLYCRQACLRFLVQPVALLFFNWAWALGWCSKFVFLRPSESVRCDLSFCNNLISLSIERTNERSSERRKNFEAGRIFSKRAEKKMWSGPKKWNSLNTVHQRHFALCWKFCENFKKNSWKI